MFTSIEFRTISVNFKIQTAKIQNGPEFACLFGHQEVQGIMPPLSVLRAHSRHHLFLHQGLNLCWDLLCL